MEIVSIEEKAYLKMKHSFDKFVADMEKLFDRSEIKQGWLTNQDVCLLLDIQKRTLQYYRDSGKLPFSKIGNKCYYKIADVEKLISDSQIKQ